MGSDLTPSPFQFFFSSQFFSPEFSQELRIIREFGHIRFHLPLTRGAVSLGSI